MDFKKMDFNEMNFDEIDFEKKTIIYFKEMDF